MPALRALSEVSVGNADRFQSLALAFGQVQANGRLMGQEVLQMVNAGFNPLQEISRTTGRSMLDLKKDMENGAVSARMVEDAFKSATSEGGRFYEMNERLKNSAAGQYAKMKSDVEMLATEIGTNLLPAAKALMEVMSVGSDKKGQGGLLAGTASSFATGLEGIVALAQDTFTFKNAEGKYENNALNRMFDRIDKERGESYINSLKRTLTEEEQLIREKNMARFAQKDREELERIAKQEKEQELEDLQEKLRIEKKITEDIEKRMRLDPQTKDRIRNSEKDFEKLKSDLKNDNPNNIAAAVAPALRAGSAEAYRFLMNQRNEAAEIAKEQADIAREQLGVQQQQLEAFQNSQMIGIAGRSA